MVWEFPAVSQTRLPFWKHPQFTKSGMFWFTLVFGWFGLHHLLLRSPQTWILFLILNMCTFGYLYFYDLIQLSSYGDFPTTDSLNQVGLQSPYWPLGIAQGMWKESAEEDPTVPKEETPPSPWLQTAYTLTLPLAPLALLFAGDKWNAFARMANWLTPLGWVLGLFALPIDYVKLLLKPAELFVLGSDRYFPFTLIQDTNGHSPLLTGQYEFKQCPQENLLDSVMKYGTVALPLVDIVSPTTGKAIRQSLATSKQAMNTATQAVQAGTAAASAVGEITTAIPAAAAETLGQAQQIISNPQAALAAEAAKKLQSGGGQQSSSSITALDTIALTAIGAVIGGGFLLAASRSFSNGGLTDSPPNPRTV
jgi:hypothetical protein